ncbi:COX15/CtaA family protein [Compostibacter hankyongensis]|uniref:COX15/CtaA family protein n=2 Tax=Compostibacter hankyongensis TaxID=1007089 RepID=A0ABP8FDM8_9BACT
MLMIQVLLGGITRLTGSGLSITEWAPIMGAVPPLNHTQWEHAFHLYQQTPQYRLINGDFSLGDFKFIFFWEWFHRLWARLIGVVFLAGFVIFLLQRRFNSFMVRPMIILFLLGALQGLIGWVMVKSGLVGDNTSVNPVKLTIHFMAAMVLICYTFWFALMLLVKPGQYTTAPALRRFTVLIICLLCLQLVYGGFMAGLHAALSAHTWPDINGMAVPDTLFRQSPAWSNFVQNPIMVQFIHRGLAYLLALLILWWWIRALRTAGSPLFRQTRWLPILAVFLQVTLGVLTVVNSAVQIPLLLGVLHQFVAMLLLVILFGMLFLLRSR